MRTRFAAQFVFCSPQEILRRNIVERDENRIVSNLYSMDEQAVELSNTRFFDGILSPEIISLKQNTGADSGYLAEHYNYIDLAPGNIPAIGMKDAKPAVFDFGTNSPDEINRILRRVAPQLAGFNIFEIIAGCTFYPAAIAGKTAGITINSAANLLLWQNIDLINKKITEKTAVALPGSIL
ncbi:MAG TPA: hypothetical protein VK152_02840 [Paludibacter sp.]|nr:hypothetical protein [Paludibacter sp.]